MEALDSDNMLNNAHQSLHPAEMVHSRTVNGTHEGKVAVTNSSQDVLLTYY